MSSNMYSLPIWFLVAFVFSLFGAICNAQDIIKESPSDTIVNLLSTDQTQQAQAQLEELLIQEQTDTIISIFNAVFNNQTLLPQLQQIIIQIYDKGQEAFIETLELSIAYETILEFNPSLFNTYLENLISEIIDKRYGMPGLAQALDFTFTVQTGEIRDAFAIALESVPCEKAGPAIYYGNEAAGKLSYFYFEMLYRERASLKGCEYIVQQVAAGNEILDNMGNSSEIDAGLILSNLDANNLTTVSELFIKAAQKNITDELDQALYVLFEEQPGTWQNSFLLVISSVFEISNPEISSRTEDRLRSLFEYAETSEAINFDHVVILLYQGLTLPQTRQNFINIVEASVQNNVCSISKVMQELASVQEFRNNAIDTLFESNESFRICGISNPDISALVQYQSIDGSQPVDDTQRYTKSSGLYDDVAVSLSLQDEEAPEQLPPSPEYSVVQIGSVSEDMRFTFEFEFLAPTEADSQN